MYDVVIPRSLAICETGTFFLRAARICFFILATSAPDLLVRFFHGFRVFGEPVKQNTYSRLVKEAKDAVTGLSESEPHFPELALNLGSIRVIQSRPVLG